MEQLSWVLASGAIITAFAVSGNLLTELGSAYITEGGTLVEKIHPASYLMIMAGTVRFGIACAGRVPAWGAFARHRPLIIYVGGIIFCAAYCLVFSGTGGIIALLDTYLPAGCAAFALSATTRKQREWLGLVIILLCTVNAAIAIVEAALQANFITLGPDTADAAAEFRPTALYDHPLTGAAATMLGLLLTARPGWPSAIMLPCQAVLLVGLVCFGERAPLAIGLGVLLCAAIVNAGQRIIHRRRCSRRIAALVWTASAACLVIGLVVFEGLSERLAAHSYWDDSAQVRLSQFRILAWLTPAQLMFGCNRDDLIALLEPLRLAYRVGVIENFWLVMMTSLGLLCFPIFVMSLWQLLRWLWRTGDRSGRLMVIVLIATASTSNSLGRKSTLLMMLVACVVATAVGSRVDLKGNVIVSGRRAPA
jgi:hypothetical protein